MKLKLNIPLWLPCLFVLMHAVGFAPAITAQNQRVQPVGANSKSLSSALNHDGSVKTNLSGSFDPKGYRMAYGPKGDPRFVPAVSAAGGASGCADGWDDRFPMVGPNSSISTVAVDGAGNMYVGGGFTAVGNVIANHIAKWDGNTWSALGSGMNAHVSTIAMSGNDVYVGGDFMTAGGVTVNRIAKWNGNSWSALGSGMNNSVNTIGISGTDIYAGGTFTTAGGVTVNYIAKWNGTVWTGLGSGMSNFVRVIAISGTDLYAGGRFTLAGGIAANRIAKWNGTEWSAFGSGIGGVPGSEQNTEVRSIALAGTDVYAGGDFRFAGGLSANNIAKWNGTAWSALSTGLTNSGFSTISVDAIAVIGSDVYAGGIFNRADGSTRNSVAKWNGTSWSGLGSGMDNGNSTRTVSDFVVIGSDLVAVGAFTTSGGVATNNIAKWNGSAWSAVVLHAEKSIAGPPNAIAVSGTDVYVGGSFTTASGVTVNNIAKWNGTGWSNLGPGVSGPVHAIAVSGNDLYAGGDFGIAKWNGTSWSGVGTLALSQAYNGFPLITAIAVSGIDVYIAGSFFQMNGSPAQNIAKWNGTSWSLVGMRSNPGHIFDMVISGSNIYVAHFYLTGSIPNIFPAFGIQKWDGNSWTALPSLNGQVSTLAVFGTDLYAGGSFDVPSGNRIAKWNGTSWSQVGVFGAVNGSVDDIAISGTDLYVGGTFFSGGVNAINYIARWDGSSWSKLGTGTNNAVSKIAVSGTDVFAGGYFTTAGCSVSAYFGRYMTQQWNGSTNADWHTAANWTTGSVPSAGANLVVAANDASILSSDVTVNDLMIRDGRTVTVGAGRTLTVTGILNLSGGSIAGQGTVNITTCSPNSLTGGRSGSMVSAPLTRCVNNSGAFNFPMGSGSVYSPVELSNIVGTSNFTVEPRSDAYSGTADGLPVNRLQRWWQLTNGGIQQADLTFGYADSDIMGTEGDYRIYRVNEGTAERLPTTINPASNRATVRSVTSFSPWTMAESASANVSVAGRIIRTDGRGVPFVMVTLTDTFGNTRTYMANHFGYYTFDHVPAGRTYTISVTARKSTVFAETQRVIDVTDELTNVDFASSWP